MRQGEMTIEGPSRTLGIYLLHGEENGWQKITTDGATKVKKKKGHTSLLFQRGSSRWSLFCCLDHWLLTYGLVCLMYFITKDRINRMSDAATAESGPDFGTTDSMSLRRSSSKLLVSHYYPTTFQEEVERHCSWNPLQMVEEGEVPMMLDCRHWQRPEEEVVVVMLLLPLLLSPLRLPVGVLLALSAAAAGPVVARNTGSKQRNFDSRRMPHTGQCRLAGHSIGHIGRHSLLVVRTCQVVLLAKERENRVMHNCRVIGQNSDHGPCRLRTNLGRRNDLASRMSCCWRSLHIHPCTTPSVGAVDWL